MTFDDGILKIYRLTNTAENGAMPTATRALLLSSFFGFETVGYRRYFTALQANREIDYIVNIPEWHDEIKQTDEVKLEDGIPSHDDVYFRVAQKQMTSDDDGIRITRLSLTLIKGA